MNIIIGIVSVGTVALWLVLTIILLHIAAERESWKLGLVAFLWIVVPLGTIVGLDYADREPCAKYETRMMFNAATKTMMPAKFCVLRGDWID